VVCDQRIGYVLVQPGKDLYVGSFDVLSHEAERAARVLVAAGKLRTGRISFARCPVTP
jgi:hypothetical protein